MVSPLPLRALAVTSLAASLLGCHETAAHLDDHLAAREAPASAELATPAAVADVPVREPAPSPPPANIPSPQQGGCPQAMARVEGFCIDRYEAHLVTRGAGGELTPHEHFRRPEEGVAYEARSAAGVFPQAYISRVEAHAACAHAGKRLCSRKEWQRACQGARGTIYPYGEHWEARRCNTDKQHLITLRFGADPRRWHYDDFNDPSLAQEPGFLARTGEHTACVGDAEVYDLVGNLHEWVSDTADAAFKAQLDTDGVRRSFQWWRNGNGVFMGGFFSTRGELGPGCKFTTIAHDPGYHDYSTGFRCCADPPASERASN